MATGDTMPILGPRGGVQSKLFYWSRWPLGYRCGRQGSQSWYKGTISLHVNYASINRI